MSDQKAVFPPTSKTNLAQLTHSASFKLSVLLSLVFAPQLVGSDKPAQAEDLNAPETKKLAEIKPGSNSQRRRQRQVLLPRIVNLLAFAPTSEPANSVSVTLPKRSADLTRENPTVEQSEIYLAHSQHSAKSAVQIYQVQKGDSLSKIARRYQVSVAELVKLNQIPNSNLIFINQKLQIPVAGGQGGALDSDLVAIANSNYSQSNTANVANPDEDPYITQLRAEIDQLQAEYRQTQLKENNLPNNLRSDSSVAFARANSATQESLTTNNLTIDPENSPESLIAALTLPPLADDQYLPDVFDGYIWPAQGVLTSHYGWRWGRIHRGIDIAAPFGTPIVAAAAGKVIDTGWYGGYGRLVKLEHLDGSVTLYAHNQRNLVTLGQRVKQGEQIAEMGSTGNSTGPHLHFEIHLRNKKVIDPLVLLGSR